MSVDQFWESVEMRRTEEAQCACLHGSCREVDRRKEIGTIEHDYSGMIGWGNWGEIA